MAAGAEKRRAAQVRRIVWWTARLLLAGAFSFLVPWVLGLWFEAWSDGQWGWDDWGAVVISMWLSLLFFLLALLGSRKGQVRALAVANAELITSMGSLAMSSARSFAGHDHQALRIAADARAALQHYPSASRAEQASLIATVEDSYSDLAFGTFSRADALPRSIWDQLCNGAAAVEAEADALARKLRFWERGRKEQLAAMAANVRFVQRVGQAVRDTSGQQGNRVLDGVWHEAPVGKRGQHRGEARRRLRPRAQVQRLACLYRRELTVVKQWDVLYEAVRPWRRKLTCSVVLMEDLREAKDWLAPWYVDWDPKQRCYVPVNVLKRPLEEAAAVDKLTPDRPLPRYPKPLSHGQVPAGMRTRAIGNLCDLLQRQRPMTVCVLLYDIRTRSGRKTVVLDGNHRLAAALSIHDEERQQGRGAEFPPSVRVLAFRISERRRVNGVTSDEMKFEDWEPWRGFTPDIGLIRGSWRPSHLMPRRFSMGPGPRRRDRLRWAVGRWAPGVLPIGRRTGC